MSWQEQQNLVSYAQELTTFDELSLYQQMPLMQKALEALLDPETCQQLADFSQNDANVIRVSGLPFDQSLPATPYDGYLDSNNIPIASVMQLVVFAATSIKPIIFRKAGLILSVIIGSSIYLILDRNLIAIT